MISSIIVFPAPGDVVDAGTTFSIDVQVQGLDPGAFTNAASTYYSAPQDLNGQGQIIGHTHVTVQDMGGSFTPTTPMDPTTFSFFKGINDEGNEQGLLSATVTGGLPPGFYRVCTMTSASNHQPVMMPVAQRGAQDDCTKFEVRAGGDAGNGSGDGGNGEGNDETDGSTDPDSDADPDNDNDDNAPGNGTEEPTSTDGAEEPTERPAPGDNNGDNGGDNEGEEEPTSTEDSDSQPSEPTDDVEPTDDGGDADPTDDAEPTDGTDVEPTDSAPEPTEAPSSPAEEPAPEPTATRRRQGGGRGRNRFKNRERTRTTAAEAEATPAPEETGAVDPVTGGDDTAPPAEDNTGATPDAGEEAPVEETPVEEEDSAPTGPEEDGVPIPVDSGNLGGPVPTVKRTGRTDRPFCVLGNSFVNEAAAVARACDVQKNRCANAVNSGQLAGVSVGDCEAQRAACGA